MISIYLGNIFHIVLRRRNLRALALWLPLLFALSSETAWARTPAFSPALRFTHAVAATTELRGDASSRRYAFPHQRRFQAAHFAQRATSWRRLSAYGSAQRRFARFASTRPALAAPALGVSGSSVIADALRFLGAGNVTGMRGPWCADYASMILRRTGHRPLAGRAVSAALAYGPRVRQPRAGDLVVINTRAGYAQHVGFFAGWRNGQMVMVSGNWGRRVAVSPISPRSVAAFIGV